MTSLTDQQLLRDYTEQRSESAFAELVRRHIDIVHSAAQRMVRDPHLAEDVTQGVFLAFARNSRQLTSHPVLSGWLHRTTQNLAANAVRADVRRRAREQDAAAMNQSLAAGPGDDWEQLAPHLDAALGDLSEPDRDALMVRYFERNSAREMAHTLGISDEAAQKRVNRAIERLRELFAKRGISVGAGGLAAGLTAHAVQAAPAGLAAMITSTAALTGTTLATTTTIAALKAIAMTALQKTVITATLAAVAGGGIYEARQASRLREEVRTLQREREPMAEQIQELERQRAAAAKRLAALNDDNERLNRNTGELLKLRGEVGFLRRQQTSPQVQELVQGKTEAEWIAGIVYNGDEEQTKLWRSLGTNGVRMLVRALKSPENNRDTRMRAASLLSSLKNDAKSAIPELISLIKTEPVDSVRAIELGYFEGPLETMGAEEKGALFPELLRALQSRDLAVRNNALVGLQFYPEATDTSVPLMVKALQDSNPTVRRMAVKALNKVDPQNPASADFVPVLVGCLSDVQGAANDAVCMLGDLHRDPDLAVPALIQSLQSDAPAYVRENAAAALGKFGNQAQSAVSALQKALEDSDANLRLLAAAALQRINQ